MLGKYLIWVVGVHSDGFGRTSNNNRSSGSMITITLPSDEMREFRWPVMKRDSGQVEVDEYVC